MPAPEPTERVVFISHFERGFALPVSDFFWDFLDHYDLQPHHLTANAVMILSVFAAFCEGYTGIEPFIQGWAKYFCSVLPFTKGRTTMKLLFPGSLIASQNKI
jgi:hypothetical protein